MAFGPVAPPAEEEREVRDLRSVPITDMTVEQFGLRCIIEPVVHGRPDIRGIGHDVVRRGLRRRLRRRCPMDL